MAWRCLGRNGQARLRLTVSWGAGRVGRQIAVSRTCLTHKADLGMRNRSVGLFVRTIFGTRSHFIMKLQMLVRESEGPADSHVISNLLERPTHTRS